MSIQLVTYANQTVTPTNDAIIYEKAVDQNGIFYGCNVTVTSNNVNITGGYGIVCGREFVINSESIAVTLAPSGTLDGRLYVRLDLADADAPIQLLTATGNTLPPLVQDDDVNYTNGTYEMELATFTVGVSALSDVVETFETIVGSKQVPTVIADYIVEQGTDGIWTYRKWNSGISECWGSVDTSTSFAVWTAPIYYGSTYSADQTYPTNLFIEKPILSVSMSMYGSDVWHSSLSNALPTMTSTGRYYPLRVGSGSSGTFSTQFYAIGKWK